MEKQNCEQRSPEPGAVKIWYFCNGEKDCGKKPGCYKNGGRCNRTSDVNYARNFGIVKMTSRYIRYEEKEAPKFETQAQRMKYELEELRKKYKNGEATANQVRKYLGLSELEDPDVIVKIEQGGEGFEPN